MKNRILYFSKQDEYLQLKVPIFQVLEYSFLLDLIPTLSQTFSKKFKKMIVELIWLEKRNKVSATLQQVICLLVCLSSAYLSINSTSICDFVFVCLSVSLALYLYVSLSVRLSFGFSVCMYVCPYACPSVYQYVFLSVCLSICLTVKLSVCQPVKQTVLEVLKNKTND